MVKKRKLNKKKLYKGPTRYQKIRAMRTQNKYRKTMRKINEKKRKEKARKSNRSRYLRAKYGPKRG